jgi:hypothetical protein
MSPNGIGESSKKKEVLSTIGVSAQPTGTFALREVSFSGRPEIVRHLPLRTISGQRRIHPRVIFDRETNDRTHDGIGFTQNAIRTLIQANLEDFFAVGSARALGRTVVDILTFSLVVAMPTHLQASRTQRTAVAVS